MILPLEVLRAGDFLGVGETMTEITGVGFGVGAGDGLPKSKVSKAMTNAFIQPWAGCAGHSITRVRKKSIGNRQGG